MKTIDLMSRLWERFLWWIDWPVMVRDKHGRPACVSFWSRRDPGRRIG